MRIMSVIGALALAMCLAFPATAAEPGNALTIDLAAHQSADFLAAPAADFEPVVVFDLFDAAMLAALPSAAAGHAGLSPGDDDEAPNCKLDTGAAFGLKIMTDRHRDPGWCAG